MQGTIIKESFKEREIFIYLPPSYHLGDRQFPVIYAQDGDYLVKNISQIVSQVEEGFKIGSNKEFILVGIYPTQRIDEYTPWPAKALNERFNDFGGKGKDYLSFVTDDIKSYIDEHYHTKPEPKDTAIMGYSLGGLISLYAAYETSVFGKIASLSGSFWYEKAVAFVSEKELINDQVQIFISVGDAEGEGKETIQKYAVQSTKEVISLLRGKLRDEEQLFTSFDQGGHHNNRILRYQVALNWLSHK